MDFIERIFGIAPDSGSGWLEVLLFLIPVALFAVYQLRQRRRKVTPAPFDALLLNQIVES